MKNEEKYAKDIMENCFGYYKIILSDIAMDVNTKKICKCDSFDCSQCYFSPINYPNSAKKCTSNIKHWLKSES